jgi:hypothetical protein
MMFIVFGIFLIVCRYEAAKKTGEYDGEARRRENAKHSLERYMHYFERWDAHNKVTWWCCCLECVSVSFCALAVHA